ncbi:MAG: phosphatase PAP2 family protein [Syntrophobacteraceae bacterium]
MRLDGNSKALAGIFAICTALMVSGLFSLDTRLARFIFEEVGAAFLFSRPVSNMPDLILPLVCIITGTSWAALLYMRRKSVQGRLAGFFEYMGSALPLAYLLKSVLKDAFGRTNTRFWLLHPHQLGFHWLQGGGDYSSFPSGHMVIFTVLMLGIGRNFPKLRLLCVGALLALALALLVTQYHFLSDIAAGVCVGILADLLARRGLPMLHRMVAPRPGA